MTAKEDRAKADKLYIVVPAYNEKDNVESVVKDWHDVVRRVGSDSRLVIIDDGSKDNTFSILQDLSKKYTQLVPVTKKNSGHGGTVLYGYNYALKNSADYVFQTDSDGQTDPREFWQLWEDRKDYNFQCGWRLGRQDGFSRKMVTRVLKFVVLIRFGSWIEDANTPFRLMDAGSLREKIKKIPKDYNLSNVLLSVLYKKDPTAKIRFVRITFKPRQGGVNSINLRRIFSIGKKAFSDFGNISKDIDAR